MARLYTDENFPEPVVIALRAMGHDVLTAMQAGNANQKVPDAELLAFATGMGRAVLTLNRRDFLRLHRANASHQGIVACTADAQYDRQARHIDEALTRVTSCAGELIRITKSGSA